MVTIVSVLTVDNDLSRGKQLKGQVQSTNKEHKFGRHFDSETQLRSWAEIHQALGQGNFYTEYRDFPVWSMDSGSSLLPFYLP